MIFDLSDPVGTVQMIIGIVILVELIQLLDKENLTEHIQGRVKFYSGIFGKVWGFMRSAVEGFGIIGQKIFSRHEKDQEEEHSHDANWSKVEYFEHIRVKHPDIWEQFLEEGEGSIWKKYKEEEGGEVE